jgi:hypothetical protein
LAYALSPRSQIQWGASAQQVSFGSSNFSGGSTIGTSLSYSQRVGRSQSVGVSGDYQQSRANGATASIQSLRGTWSRPIGKDAGVAVAAGVQPYTLPGVSGYRFTPTASASVNTHVRQKDTLVVGYSRTIEQGFGFGRIQQNDNVTGSYSLNLGRKFGVDLSGSYGRGASPVAPDLKLIGITSTVSTRYALVKNLMLTASYSFFTYTDQPHPTVTSDRSSLSLSYVTTWR